MKGYGKRKFVLNMLLMTAAMLIIRIIGMVFNIYFTSVIGASSTGMYHLIFSVYGFMITFSLSGTSLAVTRLVSETGPSAGRACNAIVRKSLSICVTLSVIATLSVWLFGKGISKTLFDNEYGAKALALLSASLPAVSVSAVIRGYFMAARKVVCVTASQIAEEFLSISITLYLLSVIKNTPYSYMSMIAGIAFSAIIAAAADIVMYRINISPTLRESSVPAPGYKDIFAISVPVALGSYLRSALISAENILIPKRLAMSGVASSLSEYGIIKGMSIPLMMFPAVFISSLANMLVPELADRRANHKPNGIRYIGARAIELTLYFAFMAAGVFVMCHDVLGEKFYHNTKVGSYLGLLSLLVIPMYLDTVVDSMLKGLNEQVSSLKYNIIDSLLRVAFIWFVIPKKGVYAYIFLLYGSELFNLWLSLSRLVRVTGMTLKPLILMKPLIISAIAYITADFTKYGILIKAATFAVVYIALAIAMEYHSSLSEKNTSKLWKI